MDMAISEFEEVGAAVKRFTSDDATVIVGTVIEPDMVDDLRVTLVATGLNELSITSSDETPSTSEEEQEVVQEVEETQKIAVGAEVETSTAAPSTTSMTGPTRASSASVSGKDDLGYLDIPAFLRRKAD